MTPKELVAMRQALEALEEAKKALVNGCKWIETPLGDDEWRVGRGAWEVSDKAITALREALGNSLKPKCFADYQPNHAIDRACASCPVAAECQTGEQAEQEPLLWGDDKFAPHERPQNHEPVACAISHSLGLEFGSKYPMQETKEAAEQMARQHMGAVVVTPLYAAPQPDMNLNCKSVQKRLATSWGYVKAEQQEPVARVTGYYGGRCVVESFSGAMVFPKDMALYAAPVQQVTRADLKAAFKEGFERAADLYAPKDVQEQAEQEPIRFVWNGEGWIEADEYIWKTTDDHERRELYAEPVQEPSISDGLCGGCAKKSADGWALYCVECWEKGNGQFASNEPAANAHVSNADSDILSDVQQEPFAYEVWDENDQVLILIYASCLKEFYWIEQDDIARKLYAAPVRTKDLTDDEISQIRDNVWCVENSLRAFARAVIAADREKNK